MYKLNPECWVWSPRPPLCLLPQCSESPIASAMMRHQGEEEEEEEEVDEHVCCYTTGCDVFISQGADPHWSTCEPPVHSGVPSSSCMSGCDEGASSSQQPATVIKSDQEDVSQDFLGGHFWKDPRMEAQRCVCVYGQSDGESLNPCWSGSTCIYYGVRRNMVVGVEVVEEVSIEDTVEVITEDMYADEFLDPEVLQDNQLDPT